MIRAIALAALVGLVGCGVIAPELRREAAPIQGLAEVRADPGAFAGRTIILGGTLIETRNRPEGTTLLILEARLGLNQEPRTDDASGGRFMIRFPDYLDPALFAPGRRVTVAGAVAGTTTEPVGGASYAYVVLDGREVYLWKEPSWSNSPPWAPYEPWYPWWYDPRWGRRPWWW